MTSRHLMGCLAVAFLVPAGGCAAWFRQPSPALETVMGPHTGGEIGFASLGEGIMAAIKIVNTWDGATLILVIPEEDDVRALRTQVDKLAHDIRYGRGLGILIGPELFAARVRVDTIGAGVSLRITTDDPDLAPILQQRVQTLSRRLMEAR